MNGYHILTFAEDTCAIQGNSAQARSGAKMMTYTSYHKPTDYSLSDYCGHIPSMVRGNYVGHILKLCYI